MMVLVKVIVIFKILYTLVSMLKSLRKQNQEKLPTCLTFTLDLPEFVINLFNCHYFSLQKNVVSFLKSCLY